jgi:hypothetical protein
MVESECVIPAMPVSDIAGAMADVSAPGVAALFSQLASKRIAETARIVFIVTPSGVGSAVDVWVQGRHCRRAGT